MNRNRARVIALVIAAATLATAGPASAAKFDGKWGMVAQTTRGHCGVINVGLAISRGRIQSTGGSYAFNSIRLGGRVSASGQTSLRAVTGPRTARGTGRFTSTSGTGTWSAVGPSGRCYGVWNANRY